MTLLTPNWQSRLPGFPYDGADPDGYLSAVEVAELIDRFAVQARAPVRPGTDVTSVRLTEDGYLVTTSQGEIRSRAVVIASGACNQPSVPALAQALPPHLEQLTPFEYRTPTQLPDGGVLVVGASATGVQLAAELQQSGRPVVLAVGEHVRLPRTYRGRDILWWMDASGLWRQRYDEVDDLTRARRLPSPQLVGTPERTTLDLNALTAQGVELVGRWSAVRESRALFSGGLRNVCSLADLKLERLFGPLRRLGSCRPGRRPTAPPSASRRPRFRGRRGWSSTSEAARSVRSSGLPGSGPTTGGSTCRSSTRRVTSATTAASSKAPGCTRWAYPCCGGATPRSSTASRTMHVT